MCVCVCVCVFLEVLDPATRHPKPLVAMQKGEQHFCERLYRGEATQRKHSCNGCLPCQVWLTAESFCACSRTLSEKDNRMQMNSGHGWCQPVYWVHGLLKVGFRVSQLSTGILRPLISGLLRYKQAPSCSVCHSLHSRFVFRSELNKTR